MSRLIPAAERILRARKLIQKARQEPLPADTAWKDFSYVAQVKDILRQARDLVKFIAYSVGASPETKAEAAAVIAEADQTEKELLHRQ